MEIVKRILAFDSLCRAQTGLRNISKHSTVFAEPKAGVAERLLAFDSLWTGLVIVTSNVYSVFV